MPENDESGSLLGKLASDLQDDVNVTESRISGVLKYVDDYTGFSGNPAEQAGHYLALKCETIEDATVTIQLLGEGTTTREPKELDSDMNMVLRITNPAKQSLKVVASKEGYQDAVKIFTFRGLKFE